jgi:hypothetical protein
MCRSRPMFQNRATFPCYFPDKKVFRNLQATNLWNRPDVPLSPTISHLHDGLTQAFPFTSQKSTHTGKIQKKISTMCDS